MLERRIVELPRNGTRYCVVGPKMSLDFHFDESIPSIGPIAGLETHYSERPSYLEGQEPFSEECWLTGARCWGDGTSLYATEYLYPLFKEGTVDEFWPVLEREWRNRYRDAFGDSHEA